MSLFPAYDHFAVWVEPWTENFAASLQVLLMGFLVCASCALVGNYLILRRLALVGDAVSHSVLPGLALAFIVARRLDPFFMVLGAAAAGIATTLLIEFIHERSRVKTDAAIGIAFCTLFAIGVLLIEMFASTGHLDADCVLFGQLEDISWEKPVSWLGLPQAPAPIYTMGAVFLVVGCLILLFFKELLLTSFDAALASSLGFSARLYHYGLMAVLAILVVSAFEAVGAILVVAMLVLPGASAFLLTQRLAAMHGIALLHALASAVLGFHLSRIIDCPAAASMVVAGAILFGLVWIFAPRDGLVSRGLARMRSSRAQASALAEAES